MTFLKIAGKTVASETQIPDHYAHRRNHDGTLDSICKLCYLTVARAYRELDLTHLELRHVCQPVERRRSTRIAHRIFDCASAEPSK